MFDILIKNGFLLGDKKTPYKSDIGISKERIKSIGVLKQPAKKIIDAEGFYVSPGFIDVHSHGDFILLGEKPFLGKVTQGITTEVIGNCGFSAAPFNEKNRGFIKSQESVLGKPPEFAALSWKKYIQTLKKLTLVTNVAPLVGHGSIKSMVAGIENVSVPDEDIKRMKNVLDEIMEQGCWGMSSGLIYPPGIFTPAEEFIPLVKIISKYGGIYSSHIRGEGRTLIPAVEEILSIGEKTGVSVEISHLKALGRENWSKTDKVLEMILKKRKQGVNVNFDQYPYTAASTTASVLFPHWMHEGGFDKFLKRLSDLKLREKVKKDVKNGVKGWENWLSSCGCDKIIIQQVKSLKNRKWQGKTLKEISEETLKDPVNFMTDLMFEEKGNVNISVFSMSEKSICKFLKEKIGFIGTDGIPGRRPHPRLWGSFPRILSRYVREKQLISLQEAVYKFSKGPAEKFGLKDRGEISPGKIADIVIFDSENVNDCATYQNPVQKSSGIPYVIVNGKTVIENGKFTGKTSGNVLLRK